METAYLLEEAYVGRLLVKLKLYGIIPRKNASVNLISIPVAVLRYYKVVQI